MFKILGLFLVLFSLWEPGTGSVPKSPTSNWAVIISTSRFWFNYRHTANALSIYHTVKRMGIPDSQIILMIADDHMCDPRNSFPSVIWSGKDRAVNLFDGIVEVDYRGYDVSAESITRVLTGTALEN